MLKIVINFLRENLKGISEDLRKIGTTAMGAALVSFFLSKETLLVSYIFIVGTIIWILGLFITPKSEVK
jgi:hypothetical protein